MSDNSTRRFSNRVADYIRYRPGYPAEITSYLQREHGLAHGSLIADIGAGTGIFSKLLLDAGYKVIAVEPNQEMHDAAVASLKDRIDFSTTGGTAEATELDTESVDAIVAGQAFHWFDREKAKTEFSRILRKHGIVALIWNERLQQSAFEQEYDALITKHARDYVQVNHRNVDMAGIEQFFSPHKVKLQEFDNQQTFDFKSLLGRLLSSSYMPTHHDENYGAMHNDLHRLFDRHKHNGTVTIHYATKLYTGRLS